MRAGDFALPFGSLTVTFDESQLFWAGTRSLTHFVSASDLEISGLNNRYVCPGIGAPLAASTVPLHPESGVSDFVAPKVKVPANLFLRIEQPRQGLADGQLRAALELRTDVEADAVRVDDHAGKMSTPPLAGKNCFALLAMAHSSDFSNSRSSRGSKTRGPVKHWVPDLFYLGRALLTPLLKPLAHVLGIDA